jgi:hypothetical protein
MGMIVRDIATRQSACDGLVGDAVFVRRRHGYAFAGLGAIDGWLSMWKAGWRQQESSEGARHKESSSSIHEESLHSGQTGDVGLHYIKITC